MGVVLILLRGVGSTGNNLSVEGAGGLPANILLYPGGGVSEHSLDFGLGGKFRIPKGGSS